MEKISFKKLHDLVTVVQENIPTVYKCETNIETFIISAKDIISIKPILIPNDEGGETYMRVEFYDNELCVTNSIYCTKIEQNINHNN